MFEPFPAEDILLDETNNSIGMRLYEKLLKKRTPKDETGYKEHKDLFNTIKNKSLLKKYY